MIRWPSPDSMPDALAGSTLRDWLPAQSVFQALQQVAATHGDRTALAFLPHAAHQGPPIGTTYRELVDHIARTANMLRHIGVGPRDVVAYVLPALPETHHILWGAETAGIALPINPLLKAEDIAALLSTAGAKVLVALGPTPGTDIWEKARRARELAPCVRTLMSLGKGEAPGADADFAKSVSASSPQLTFEPPASEDAAAYFHTGGTTGAPKLVIQTHRNQLAAAYGGAVSIGARPEDVMLNGLPMFHVAATIFGSLSMLLAGAQVVILSPAGVRDPNIVASFWRIAGELRATLLGGVPTSFAAALAHPPGDANLSSVRANVCGAALTPAAVSAGVERVTGKPLREVYGMTECGGVICVDPVWTERVNGSAGLPVAFCEVQARAIESGQVGQRVCAAGEPGVIVVRGPNVSPGYLQHEHNVGLFTADGWLVTGDLGRVDADGRVFITGRLKDLIIRGGHNIDPAVIEACLRQHPCVADAAAVGMPDAYAGEVPVAYVSLKPETRCSEAELRDFAAQRIAERPALPRFVKVLPQLPLTAVGKPYKPALRLAAAQAHFSEILASHPVDRLEVTDVAGRGMTVNVHLSPEVSDGVAACQAITELMRAYNVRLAFDRACDVASG